MKKFKAMKNIEQISKDAIAQGWEVDFEPCNKGDDWFWIRDMKVRFLQVAVNCFGRFMVYSPISDKPIATEKSENLDNEKWYTEILDLLYIPLD